MSPKPVSTYVGYDPSIVLQMPSADRKNLDLVAHAWFLSAGLLSYPLGLCVYLVEESALLSGCTMVSVFLLILNVIRLTNAGGGAPTEVPFPPAYRPGALPVVLMLGLGILMAQPAQLATQGHTSPTLPAARSLAHDQSSPAHSATAGSNGAIERTPPHAGQLLSRLGALLDTPERTVLFSAVFVAVISLPALFSHVLFVESSRDYARRRHRQMSQAIAHHQASADTQVAAALSAYSSFRPPLAPLGPRLPRTMKRGAP